MGACVFIWRIRNYAFKLIGHDEMLFGSLFRNNSIDCPSESFVIPGNTSLHQIYEQIAAGHVLSLSAVGHVGRQDRTPAPLPRPLSALEE